MSDLLFRSLVLYYTDKCTARCSHCVTRSGPKSQLKLPLPTALDCMDGAHSLGIPMYGITGGEPLIYFDEIAELVRHGSSLGMTGVIATNAFWGTTYEKALKICSFLRENNIVGLNLSADIFHTEFISLDRVLNVIKAANALGDLATVVTAVVVRKDKNSLEILKRLAEHTSRIKVISPAPFGRGSELGQELLLTEPTTKLLRRRCDEVSSPVVAPDGRVLTCCSFPVSLELDPTTPFILGNVYEEPLKAILQRAAQNPWLQLLDQEGPGGFVYQFGEVLEANGYEMKPRYYGHCHLCVELFKTGSYLEKCTGTDLASSNQILASATREF